MKATDSSLLHSLSPAEIVGLTIFGEARGEPIEGQVAVGSVLRNRLQNSNHKSYHDICLFPLQFSCWNDDDVNYPLLIELANKLINGQKLTDIFMRQSMLVGSGIVNWDLRDNSNSSLYYMTKKLFFSVDRPKWARVIRTDPVQIGSQIFFDV